MLPRSYLFVPGNRPDRFAKALASGADAVVLDLEDAVAADAKAAARDATASWLGAATDAERARTLVRINDLNSGASSDDLRLLAQLRVAGVMLPKAESTDQVQAVRAAVPGAAVLPILESALGIARTSELAHAAGVERLVFGTLDYALDLELDISARLDGLVHAAGVLTVASRVAGLPTPVAGVTPQLDDAPRLRADLDWACCHGFGAKLCIHPRQVEPVHDVLSPSPQAVDWARRVLAADAASPGAAQLDGRMIDRPVVLQAQRTLQRARR